MPSLKKAAPLAGPLFALLMLAFATPARANGRYPASTQLVVMPGAPSTLVMRMTFGLLVSKDSGATWDFVCERAIGYGSQNEDPMIGLTSNGSILAGTFEGLPVSPDTGCNWSFASGGPAGQVIIDLVVRPDNPHAALAMTSSYIGEGGVDLYRTQLYATADDGATWASYGSALDPTVLSATVEVAATDPKRVYITGTRGQGATRTASVFVSTDPAMPWVEHSVPINPTNEEGAYLAAVDPASADFIYVRTGPSANVPTAPSGQTTVLPSRLLVSMDAGVTFKVAFAATGPMFGFALSPDGSKVFVGGPQDGVQLASKTNLMFAQQSSQAVQCLATSGTTLYACSNQGAGFIVGASQDDGKTFTPLLALLCGIRGPLSCPAAAPTSSCGPDWETLRDLTFLCPDAGAPPPGDAGGDAGAPPPPPAKSSGCSCRQASPRGGALAAFIGLVALVGFGLRSRARPKK
jgi:hypothetical protein